MSRAVPPRYLDYDELAALSIGAREVVDAIEAAMRARAEGRAWTAPKSAIQVPDGRFVMSTLAVADDPPFVAVKSLALNPDNPSRGLDLMNALVTLLDARSGLPVAVLDGNWVTAVRTAGLSAVAARWLARPQASRIAFVGCGAQARAHLTIFAELYPLTHVLALGRGASNRDRLLAMARSMGLEAHACETPDEVLADADIVVTSVTHDLSMRPFLDAGVLAPGAFAAVTDLGRPWIGERLRAFDRIVIDDVEQESQMAKPMVEPSLVAGDLQMVVTRTLEGRRNDDERTAFVFRGMAIGDLALAALAWRRTCG